MQYATVHSQEPPPADARRGNTKEPPQKKKNGFDWFHSGNADAPNPGQPNETPVALYAWHGSVVRNALWELNHG